MRLRECLCLRVSPSPAVFANTELVTEALWTASFTVFLGKAAFYNVYFFFCVHAAVCYNTARHMQDQHVHVQL